MLLARIYKSLGMLSKGHLIETDRSGLVAGYIGQTALKVKEVTEGTLGGVLFIHGPNLRRYSIEVRKALTISAF